jgi:hypothetical protein
MVKSQIKIIIFLQQSMDHLFVFLLYFLLLLLVVKLLLGSIDPDIDNLDEIKTSNPNRSSSYEIQTPPPSIQPQSCCEIM